MEIHKATALEQYAQEHGQASIRYDQSSVGLSEGVDRTEANNDVWIRDTLAMMDIVADKEPVVLVSSSNGGQVSAYIAKIRTEQVKGLLMIGNNKIKV
jgi:pimeloyl-ACP methyl ester carboxylesterase